MTNTNEVAEQKDSMVQTFDVNGESVRLSRNSVKQFLTSGNDEITDEEAMMFIALCKYQHLNPFLNEAYLVKFKGRPAQNIVSKEAFMKRAEANPQYDGLKAGCLVIRGGELVYTKGAFKLPKDQLVGGWAEVYRKDRKEPTHIEIEFNEFSKGQATWKQMPANMIRKTAIVNALREAFPQDLGAMYTEEDKQDTEHAPKPVVEANVQPKKSIDELVGNDSKEPVKDVTPSSTKLEKAQQKSSKDDSTNHELESLKRQMTPEEIAKLQDNFLKQSMAEGDDDDVESKSEPEQANDTEQTELL